MEHIQGTPHCTQRVCDHCIPSPHSCKLLSQIRKYRLRQHTDHVTGWKCCVYFYVPKSESVLMKWPSVLYCTICCLYNFSPVWHGVTFTLYPAGFVRSVWPAGPNIAVKYLHLVCLLVCASPLIMCAIIMSRTLLPCDFTLASLMAALSTTKGSLAQLWVHDTKKQRQHRCEADQDQKWQKQTATRDAYRVTYWLRMASRRALEWNEMFKSPAGLDMNITSSQELHFTHTYLECHHLHSMPFPLPPALPWSG